jgi:hypothetical protein
MPGVLHMVLNLLFENLPTCITYPIFWLCTWYPDVADIDIDNQCGPKF